MSILKEIEDGIKKGFRIQYELGRLNAVKFDFIKEENPNNEAMIKKIDCRIAKFEKEMDLINEFFGFDKN